MDRKTRFLVESKYCHNFGCSQGVFLSRHHMRESSWTTEQLVDAPMTEVQENKYNKTASWDIYTRLLAEKQGCMKGVTQLRGSLLSACERASTPPLPHQNINSLPAVSALLYVSTRESRSFSALVQKVHENTKNWYRHVTIPGLDAQLCLRSLTDYSPGRSLVRPANAILQKSQ